MTTQRLSKLLGLATLLLFGAGFLAVFLDVASLSVLFPLLFGLLTVSMIARFALGAMQAKPALERIAAALSGRAHPELGSDWRRGEESGPPAALSAFACGRLAADPPLVGSSDGRPAHVSYERLVDDSGSTHLATLASVASRVAVVNEGTVVMMRQPSRPWQRLAEGVVDGAATPAGLGAAWRVAATDAATAEAIVTSQRIEALAASYASVSGAVWTAGEVTVIEDGHRTSAAPLAELIRLASRLAV
ncbi:hypothetical protein LGT39_03660 [Demequina sp. TTPB684]|uniref:hypothetical protein n=1 Tax=unclassified Demequina TaxID=2620311 RepID=UPI001CF1A2EA|nr:MULTISPECIES: hypothetical protein [unclassified Demequina]MCB2411944.1 hypothetical protein [Demequina sp. TTPB684]UPU87145.1 hypothetical protein LGT36_007595 [Demequina sp. TMPB413]